MATKSIPVKDICIDGGTQHRSVDDAVVAHYAEMNKEGSKFPPIEIITDGKNNYLCDGFHRLAAAKKLGKNYIECNIGRGTKKRAQYLSFSANKDNGLPRPDGTVKEILRIIYNDEEWSKISQRDISRHVGCTQAFVSKIHAEMKKSASDNQLSDRIALSGSKTGIARSKTVNVKRGESKYEMQIPEKKVLDSTGKQVPEHLVKFFERTNEFRQKIKQLNDMQKWVADGKDKNDLFFKYIKIENLKAEIGNVKRIFRFALPYAVCRYCGGDVNNEYCKACDGSGFVNEAIYDATPRDLKK
jgi:hypothetical protein